MKILKSQTRGYVRIIASRPGTTEQSYSLSLTGTTVEKSYEWARGIIEEQRISPFEANCSSTRILIRWIEGRKAGESKTMSFKGISPEDVSELLTKNID